MTDYAILCPGLDAYATKLLRAAVTSAHLPWVEPVSALPDDDTRYVLSCGKDALQTWHDFGLIQVHANQGAVFTHISPVTARTYHIMVVEHPGAMAQQSITRHDARVDMRRNLGTWHYVLDNIARGVEFPRSGLCGGCLKSRDVLRRRRAADRYVPELDMVGLCEDHYRRRATYKRKVKRVARKDMGKMENQIAGQLEMLPGDGTKVRVSKG